MIGALEGKIILRKKDTLLVMIGGVGYWVYVAGSLLSRVIINNQLFLYTYTHVREDTLDLFGFEKIAELQLFEMLLSVSGVGPKTALNVVDHGVDEIYHAVKEGDVSFFTAVPRLGNKNAQKIIIELRTKLGSSQELDLGSSTETQEILEVLISMGFSKGEAIPALQKLPSGISSIEEKIKQTLKLLGRK